MVRMLTHSVLQIDIALLEWLSVLIQLILLISVSNCRSSVVERSISKKSTNAFSIILTSNVPKAGDQTNIGVSATRLSS